MLGGSFKSLASVRTLQRLIVFGLLAGPVLHPLYDFLAVFYRTAGTGCILEAFQSLG